MRRRRLLTGAAAAAAGVAAWATSTTHAAALGQTNALRNSPLPPPLRPGSRILALAPGTWLDPQEPWLETLRQRCRQQQWTLITPTELGGRWHWFSATDQERASAWRRAWLAAEVDALFYVGAGWGSARVLEQGWSPPPQPRWCVGFSDASALLLAQWAAGSAGGIHAGFGGGEASWQRLVALLQRRAVEPLLGQPLQAGEAMGPLVVTNLTIATSLIGTQWLPSLRGSVLVLEDTGEAPYRVDRMLTQWRSAGLFEGVRGIGLGRFSWAEDDILPGDFSMQEILVERLQSLGIPLVAQLPVGHGQPNNALPIGQPVRLDGRVGSLSLL